MAESTFGGSWWKLLLFGTLSFLVGVILLGFTGNPNLFPTVVMVGNFIVPAAYVAFIYERRRLSGITMGTTVLAFLWGGLLGVFAASLLEPLVQGMTLGSAFILAGIEELAKILGVLIIARRRRHDSEMDGLILGTASGMGFAALESMGYAFTAFMASQGSLSATVGITLFRGALSPVGHGTWTALLVSVMAREGSAKHFRVNGPVIGALVLVTVLHGLWNILPSFAAVLLNSALMGVAAQLVVGAAGVILLARRYREARKRQDARQAQIELEASEGESEPGENDHAAR